jgi:uncharacterized membrane protein (UPF0182 family)
VTATLFVHPMTLSTQSVLYLVLPLLAAVAVAYKTIRVREIERLPREIVVLVLYMTIGVIVLGVGLWLVQEYWP